jgi:DNA-binding NarL/FixJ family response regulator
MRNMYGQGVIIYDEISLIRNRISNLLWGFHIYAYEASQEIELFNYLSDKELNICLIIMDIGSDANKGYSTLAKIKEMRSDIPVIILTSNSKRGTFVRGISEGATDYILKPFDDDYLLRKIMPIINKNEFLPEKQVNSDYALLFDVKSYLKTEFKKAKKGNYSITILMCAYFLPVDSYSIEIEKKYIRVSDLFYDKFKSIIWDTDVFERYGAQMFLGIFPFCGLNNVDKLQKKIRDSFDDVKNENIELSDFCLALSSFTYPSDAEDPKEILSSLGTRMKKMIDEIKSNRG